MKPIFLWRTIPLHDRNHLPSKPGLYAIKSLGRVMYVGKSADLKRRWGNHHRYRQASNLAWPHLAYITMSESRIHDAEKKLIARIDPPWNDKPVPSGRIWAYVRMFLLCVVILLLADRYWDEIANLLPYLKTWSGVVTSGM